MKKTIVLLMIVFSFGKVFAQNNSGLHKSELKMLILADKNTCWTCLETIKTISQLQLNNTRLLIQILLASDDKSIIDNIRNQYKIDCEIYLDPLSLYAKEYKFNNLPALVLYNSNGEIEIKEEWTNPKKYIELIRNLDEKAKSANFPIIDGLKYVKSLGLKDEYNNTVINSANYFNGAISLKKEEYYISDQLNKKIKVFDSNGVLIKDIILPCDTIACNQPYLLKLYNDSILTWIDFSKNGVEEFNCLNTNTYKLNVHVQFNCINLFDSLLLSPKILRFGNNGKYIAQLRYLSNTYLSKHKNLLVLLDTNFQPIKQFGVSDSIFQNLKMSRFISGEISVDIDSENNIYYLTQLSNCVYKYDSEGSFLETIPLGLDSSFKKILKDYPSKVQREQVLDFRYRNSITGNIIVEDNSITLLYFNFHKLDNAESVKYCVDKFAKNGKRLYKKPIELPAGWNPIAIDGNKIVLYNDKRSDLIFHWYEIE